mgnify:CR=1 FL=1
MGGGGRLSRCRGRNGVVARLRQQQPAAFKSIILKWRRGTHEVAHKHNLCARFTLPLLPVPSSPFSILPTQVESVSLFLQATFNKGSPLFPSPESPGRTTRGGGGMEGVVGFLFFFLFVLFSSWNPIRSSLLAFPTNLLTPRLSFLSTLRRRISSLRLTLREDRSFGSFVIWKLAFEEM